MVHGYYTEEAIECAISYANLCNPIDVPMSCHEGRLI
jgi:hypothetical protein